MNIFNKILMIIPFTQLSFSLLNAENVKVVAIKNQTNERAFIWTHKSDCSFSRLVGDINPGSEIVLTDVLLVNSNLLCSDLSIAPFWDKEHEELKFYKPIELSSDGYIKSGDEILGPGGREVILIIDHDFKVHVERLS